jgi:phenylacetate-coenzyme A ligase PaaK-like adenylate-forming protein
MQKMDKNCFSIIYTDVFLVTTPVVRFRQGDVVARVDLLPLYLGPAILNMWSLGKGSM